MHTLRTASTLLVLLALAACASGDPTGPDQPSYRDSASGTVSSPDRPSFGGNYIGSGY